MKKQEKKEYKKVYKFLCLWEGYGKPSDFVLGLLWIIVIVGFPVWIWFYIIYKIIEGLGFILNNVKSRTETDKERKERLDERYSYY